MIKFTLGAALAIATLAVTPASAASTVTNLFMANVKANVAFLDESAKLAAAHSRSATVRAFAKAQVAEAVRIASLLDGVAPRVEMADASGDTMVTGRSVATTPAMGQAANGRAALGRSDVGELAKLAGRSFDDALWLKQVDALSQLRADYETYAAHGDDAVLVAVSKRELPKVEARLMALTKI